MMEHSDKAKFILALHKHSLQAFDAGGTVLGGPSQAGINQSSMNPSTQGIGGAIGSFLGAENNYQASGANLQQGTNANQLNQAYNGAQNGLNNQQSFLTQAQAQNGFGNQANVFSQQQQLGEQLAAQARGEGPNVAMNQLNQTTGQNIANQGALMASQRGASSNPALLARQAAMQGANTQQQAVGQAATLGAQQQIAAQQALANQQAQMQQVAGNQIQTQGQGATNLSSAQQAEQNILQNSNTSANNAAVAQQGNINNVNAQTAAANTATNKGIMGGLLGSIPVIGGAFKAKGGMIEMPDHLHAVAKIYHPHMYASGGDTAGTFQPSVSEPSSGPSIAAPAPLPAPAPKEDDKKDDDKPDPEQIAAVAALAAKGGKVKAKSPDEKAVKKDNSYANDKVPTLLSEGEIVLPRSVTMHPEAPQKAAEFVAATLAKRNKGKK